MRLVVVLAAALALAAPASAGTWTHPGAISTGGGFLPRVAVNGPGDAIVAWTQDGGAWFADRPAGDVFRAPQRLGDGGWPAAAINDSGDAVIAWTGADGRVYAALRAQHGSFSDPHVINAEQPSTWFDSYRMSTAINARGDIAMAWLEPPVDNSDPATSTIAQRVMVVVRPAGGQFSAPQELAAGNDNWKGIEAGLDDAGRVTLAWQNSETWVATGDVEHGLGGPQPAGGDPNAHTLNFSLAVTPAGDATLVATVGPFRSPESPGLPNGVYVSMRPAGGQFGPFRSIAQTYGPPFFGADYPHLSVGPGGAAAVLWSGGFPGFSVKPAGGDWLPPQLLETGDPENPRDGVVGIDARGRTVFVEARERGDYSRAPIIVMRRLPGGTMEPPVTLGAAHTRNVGPAIAFDDVGNGILVWEGGDNDPGHTSGYDTKQPIKASLYDGSFPTIESFAVANRRTSFRVRVSESGRLDVTIRRSTRTVGRMHARVKPSTRLVRIPRRVRRKLQKGRHYVATATARDSANRRSKSRRIRF